MAVSARSRCRRTRDCGGAASPASRQCCPPPLRPRGGCPNASAGGVPKSVGAAIFFEPCVASCPCMVPRTGSTTRFLAFLVANFARLKLAIRLYASAAASIHASTLQKEATRSPPVPQRGWLQNLGEQRSLWARASEVPPSSSKALAGRPAPRHGAQQQLAKHRGRQLRHARAQARPRRAIERDAATAAARQGETPRRRSQRETTHTHNRQQRTRHAHRPPHRSTQRETQR